MVGIASDVTEQTRNQEALRDSEQHFRQMADTAPALLWLAGPDGRCTYVNRFWTAFTGRRLEQEIGTGWTEAVHPQDRHRNFELYLDAVARRQPFLIEYQLRRHDGVYRWVLDAGVPRFTADGVCAGYIGSAVDVTELKTARRALSNLSQRLMEAQEAERARMAKELDDEIVQRVVLLTIELDGLFESLPGGAAAVDARANEVRSRAGDLVRQLQSLSRRLHSTKLELLGLSATAGSYCRELAEQQGVTIDFVDTSIPGDLSPEVSLQLFRVLQEALTNAVTHSGTRHFVVRLRGLDDVVELEISDEGRGFDPTAALAGRGTGLIAMHERLDGVGGSLSVDSRPDGGTRVQARVPRAAAAGAGEGGLETSPGRFHGSGSGE
jgi:PAS domain S-box-containing protein